MCCRKEVPLKMATKLVVDAGICGKTTTIDVVGLPGHKVKVSITSDCEGVSKMSEELKELDWMSLWEQEGDGYSAYQAASQCTQHFMCPVPVAVLKAIEVEVGLALPKDVTLSFKKVKSGQE
jgi:hypothetical protein